MRKKKPPAEVIELRAEAPERLMDPLWADEWPGGERQAGDERAEWIRDNPRNTLSIDEARRWMAGSTGYLRRRPRS
jgi:hypothetical protein